MDRLDEAVVLRLTVVLLAAGLPLVALGTAGVAASSLLVVGLLAAGGAGYVTAQRLDGTAIERVDEDRYYADLWIGFVLAAAVLLVWLDATPGEVQSLGGLVGLVGMANYFMRPVYYLLYGLGQRLSGAR